MAKKLSKKEKGFIRDYVKTGNGTQSIMNNYNAKSEHVAGVMAVENLAKPRIQEVIKSIADRIPDELLERVHIEGLNANRVISANITYGDADEKTNDFIEVPDHAVRHKFLDSGYKLKGIYAPEKKDITTQGERLSTIPMEAIEIIEADLKKRKTNEL